MKRQVDFTEDVDAYRFSLNTDPKVVFEISKSTLSFSADSFYKCFFKGITEKPTYEVVKPEKEPKGQAKHVFETVEAIFTKACDSIDEAWFVATDEQNTEPLDCSSKDDSSNEENTQET